MILPMYGDGYMDISRRFEVGALSIVPFRVKYYTLYCFSISCDRRRSINASEMSNMPGQAAIGWCYRFLPWRFISSIFRVGSDQSCWLVICVGRYTARAGASKAAGPNWCPRPFSASFPIYSAKKVADLWGQPPPLDQIGFSIKERCRVDATRPRISASASSSPLCFTGNRCALSFRNNLFPWWR